MTRNLRLLILISAALAACPLFIKILGAEGNDFPLKGLEAGKLYGVTVSVDSLYRMTGAIEIEASISDARGPVATKILHTGDLDFYLTLRPRISGTGSVKLARRSGGKDVPVNVDFRVMSLNGKSNAVIAAQPNSTWGEAQEFDLGQTIFGTNDERAFIPAPSEDAYQALVKGSQWFKFTFKDSSPKLAYFTLDVIDREVPLDLEIFQKQKDAATGKEDLVQGGEGQYAYNPEATQNFPGLYKFRTRILKPGETYYIRVMANHPAYQLRTSLYEPPPYRDPQAAVRTGMDFLINLGDSWHANTTRRGSKAMLNAMAHSETKLCIACHPTQFTTRGYLTAVQNGYPVTQRPALKFLTDRLYNNPRPLYGQQDTNWVRVIYSARTVASRIPAILDSFEKNVSREAPRPGVNTGYGNYLKLHYDSLEQMPGEEADGCSPNISPFEIGAQSWQTLDLLARQTGDSAWRDEADRVEKLLLPANTQTVIDLNWKIIALATIGRTKYQAQIDTLVEKLYGMQKEDGQWGYRFDAKSKASDFITFHAFYALALAGRRPESDPKMAKTLDFCLRTQRPEGSWQGDPTYKGFNTPFRDTQFAVMALSHLYPGKERTPGWSGAFPPPPEELHSEQVDLFLSEADQYWDFPSEAVLQGLRRTAAMSDQPLVRQAALVALGRVADPQAIEVITESLGAPTKVVQVAAAWALREIAARRATGRKEITAALSASADRKRWGATRVFNQHFRDLTADTLGMEALIRNLDDPVPHIRYQAAAGLWRWYYWQIDNETRRARILEGLSARMGREDHPMVRRGLMESVYNLLDENTGYLRAWVKAGAQDEERRRIDEGYQEVVRQQSQILARALRQGNTRTREGLLAALWDFHVRHMALPEKSSFQINLPAVFTQYVAGVPELHRPGYLYPPYKEAANFKYDVANSFQQTRIGNDSELIHFFASSGRDLEQALLACLEGADVSMKIQVLKAGHTLSEAGGPDFALAVLRLSQDPDPKVREAVSYVYEQGGRGIINLEVVAAPGDTRSLDGRIRRDVVDAVVAVLKSGGEEGLAVVLPLLGELAPDSPWTKEAGVAAALRPLLQARAEKRNYADVLRAVSSYPELLREPGVQQRLADGLLHRAPEVRRAALQVMLDRYLHDPELAPLVHKSFAGLDSALRGQLIALLNAPKKPSYKGRAASAIGLDVAFLRIDDIKEGKDLLKEEIVLKAVADSLSDRDANVRAAALDLAAKREDVRKRPEIAAALERLRQDPTPRLAKLAAALLEGKDTQAVFAELDNAQLLDFDFFQQKVQPIFTKRGADGMACVVCHDSHVILRLQPPDYNEQYTEKRSRENYRYALGVVDVAKPEKSLLLIKPTRPTDSAGDVQDYLATHNGGQRWPGDEKSPEYQTILQWIRGAR